MDLLLERRVAWRAMHPRRRAAVSLAGHCHAYELVGGLFSKAIEEYGAARRLIASWLPSNTSDEKRLVVDDLGVRIKDFALDPAQDLIVLLEHRPATGPSANTSAATTGADIRVHLRKLSTGAVAPNPAAKEPVLCRRALGPVHGCMIQIVEDALITVAHVAHEFSTSPLSMFYEPLARTLRAGAAVVAENDMRIKCV